MLNKKIYFQKLADSICNIILKFEIFWRKKAFENSSANKQSFFHVKNKNTSKRSISYYDVIMHQIKPPNKQVKLFC